MSWDLALRLEHIVSRVIAQQQINGWKFDLPKAQQHIAFLEGKMAELYDRVRPALHHDLKIPYAEVRAPFIKSGAYAARVEKYWGEAVGMVGGPYTPVTYEEPDLGSRQKVMKQLMRHGWRPQSYTDKGNPQLDEESLKALDSPIGKDIAHWYVLRHRFGQINGWLSAVRPDGRIAARAVPQGTPTGRMRHAVVVNVPTANVDKDTGHLLHYPEGEVIFGTEMRELFTVEDGFILVGYDAKGLELRLLAHYMGDPEFQEAVLDGDPHQNNADRMGVTKKVAKPTFYALLYGAGDEKLGSIVGGGAKEGKELRDLLMKGLPALASLIDKVKAAAKRGYLVGLDGRKMPVRSEHAALNLLIQGAGAVFMKGTIAAVDKWCRNKGLGLDVVRKVGDFHDESQTEVKDDVGIIELFEAGVVKAFTDVEKMFKLRCPMGVDIKRGKNWAETH